LSRLNAAILIEVRDELAKDKAQSTVNRYLAVMSNACTLAEREWECMDSNPTRRVGRLREPQGRVRYLSDDERLRLLKAAAESTHPHIHVIVLIVLTTGVRRSEILDIGWEDLNLRE
jgi:integrase